MSMPKLLTRFKLQAYKIGDTIIDYGNQAFLVL